MIPMVMKLKNKEIGIKRLRYLCHISIVCCLKFKPLIKSFSLIPPWVEIIELADILFYKVYSSKAF